MFSRISRKRARIANPKEKCVDLSVDLGPLRLRSPVITAAGTFGLADEYLRGVDVSRIGAYTTKSLSLDAWPGNPPPRIRRAPAGMINSIGLENPGVNEWVEKHLALVERWDIPIIGSVWGRSVSEFAEAASRLACRNSVIAIEVNLSCPNLEKPTEIFAHDYKLSASVIQAVSKSVRSAGKPVFAKLSPNLPSLVEMAKELLEAGATGLTLTNTVLATALEIHHAALALGNPRGGLSGPAIKPIVLRHVLEVASEVRGVPIIGTGGVFNGCDAVEMLMAGASAVGVGTASFYDPRAPAKIAGEIEAWCLRSRIFSVRELQGVAIPGGLP